MICKKKAIVKESIELDETNKSAAAELAKQFATYADIIVGFSMAQGLTFAFALGKDEPGGLRKHILIA